MINDLENLALNVVIVPGSGGYFALTCGFTGPDDLRLLTGCSQNAQLPGSTGNDRKLRRKFEVGEESRVTEPY